MAYRYNALLLSDSHQFLMTAPIVPPDTTRKPPNLIGSSDDQLSLVTFMLSFNKNCSAINDDYPKQEQCNVIEETDDLLGTLL